MSVWSSYRVTNPGPCSTLKASQQYQRLGLLLSEAWRSLDLAIKGAYPKYVHPKKPTDSPDVSRAKQRLIALGVRVGIVASYIRNGH